MKLISLTMTKLKPQGDAHNVQSGVKSDEFGADSKGNSNDPDTRDYF